MAEISGPSRRVMKTAGGNGKKHKRFLEKKDALELAQSIAGVQEKKSTTKAEKHHQAQAGQPNEERKPRASAARLKLETKALLAAQKKERIKKRKHRSQGDSTPDDSNRNDSMKRKPVKPARKSVSFA
ncbi:hypothetical protein BDQ12DRAFT_317477 [Crucibulum laeve]|uniref:Uncharacterized protein n=1 Tax=Crucibulum laeve TaxID=68775 RepID=A0A5C3LQL8_9AGAR|nr:hypothetical protein BDQ12DRAFT_317477 [Crucibulum laeve]